VSPAASRRSGQLGLPVLGVLALESLWSRHEKAWARDADHAGGFPDVRQRMSGVKAHQRIIKNIGDGDVDGCNARRDYTQVQT
jgi:hypothetical protein